VVCWQATDKTWKITVCSVFCPVGRYCLPAAAGIVAKSFFPMVEKVEKMKFPLFLSTEMVSGQHLRARVEGEFKKIGKIF